jgi:hypothetical protein
MKESYIIIKKVENSRGVTVPIIMLNGLSEVNERDKSKDEQNIS